MGESTGPNTLGPIEIIICAWTACQYSHDPSQLKQILKYYLKCCGHHLPPPYCFHRAFPYSEPVLLQSVHQPAKGGKTVNNQIMLTCSKYVLPSFMEHTILTQIIHYAGLK